MKALARVTDPQESHAAAARVASRIPTLRALILDALARHGPMTTEEMARVTRRDRITLSPRMKSMVDARLVVKLAPRDGSTVYALPEPQMRIDLA